MVISISKKPKTAKEQLLTGVSGQLPQSTAPQTGEKLPGSYDQAKGGFTASGGAFYPTKDPNFVPQKTGTEVIFNNDGSVTTKKGGETITASKKDYNLSLPTNQGLADTPTSTAIENQMNRNLAQEAQLSQIGQLTPEQQAIANSQQETGNLDYGQAVKAGIGGVLPAVAGGVATGAVGGALVGGVGAIPGAVAGGVAGLIGSFVSNARNELKQQRGTQFSIASADLGSHIKNMRLFASQGDVGSYNEQLAYIQRDYGNLKRLTDQNSNSFLGKDGIDKLASYERFLNEGGLQGLNNKMALKVNNPKLQATDLFSIEELTGE